MTCADEIRARCYAMKVGERLRIYRHDFADAFSWGWPSIYENPEQAFLSGMVGSAWGSFRVERDIETGDVIVSRHEESDRRYYVDPDRAYMFNRQPDGTLKLKPEFARDVEDS